MYVCSEGKKRSNSQWLTSTQSESAGCKRQNRTRQDDARPMQGQIQPGVVGMTKSCSPVPESGFRGAGDLKGRERSGCLACSSVCICPLLFLVLQSVAAGGAQKQTGDGSGLSWSFSSPESAFKPREKRPHSALLYHCSALKLV